MAVLDSAPIRGAFNLALLFPALLATACGGGDGVPEPVSPGQVDAGRGGGDSGALDAQVPPPAPPVDAASSDSGGDTRSDAGAPANDASAMPRPDAGAPSTPDASTSTDAAASASCERGFCSGFEEQTGTSLSGVWKSTAPNCSGDGTASIDTATVHSGQRALRIRSGGGVCNHIFATPSFDLKPLSASLWVRLYVRFESAFKDDHVTFLALHDEVSQKDLRMGGQKQIFMWNRERDDATLPELSPNGVSMSVSPKVGTWHCVEFHLQGDKGMLDTYVDGTLVPGLVVDGTETHDIDGQWLRPGPFTARVTDLRLGWESYGSQPMTLWLDDVSIGESRPGC
jgi:hypothetical protein